MKIAYFLLASLIAFILPACDTRPSVVTTGINIQESVAEPEPPPPSFSCTNPFTLQEWFFNFTATEKPLHDSVFYNFSLFSTDSCLAICLTKSQNLKNNDTATTHDDIRDADYYPLSNQEYKTLDWKQRIKKIKLQLKECINKEKFKTSSLATAKFLSISFDDADTLRLSW